jgi:large subunit ribosomal protein L6
MSKIGRKPINTTNVQVELKGQEINLKGKKGSKIHVLPAFLKAELVDHSLRITCNDRTAENNMAWGLHRALLANELKGLSEGFEQKVIINGLGFKAAVSGTKLVCTLGYSHKKELTIPQGITIEADKTGQLLTVKGIDKELVGFVASKICALRPIEPYKGTGIKIEGQVVLRKAGKTKSA